MLGVEDVSALGVEDFSALGDILLLRVPYLT